MQISDNGVSLIESFEKLELKAYQCPAKVWTIGIGSTRMHGKPVVEGQTCTKEEAYQAFKDHMSTQIYPYLDHIQVSLTQNQFDAICSLIYNIGINNFINSTLLKKLNNKDILGAADQFLVWNKANGKVLKGLVKRREAERKLFLTV